MNRRKRIRLSFNAPAVLTFTALCVIVRILAVLTDGESSRILFSVYRSSLLDPLTSVRCVTHVLGHVSWNHMMGNLMYILILGPMIEEKYGTRNTVLIVLVTAVITGVINMVFSPGIILLGASGVVFAMILTASITSCEDRTVPVTFVLVAILYLGQQIWQGLFQKDNISQMAHIAGGAVGSVLGFVLNRKEGTGR